MPTRVPSAGPCSVSTVCLSWPSSRSRKRPVPRCLCPRAKDGLSLHFSLAFPLAPDDNTPRLLTRHACCWFFSAPPQPSSSRPRIADLKGLIRLQREAGEGIQKKLASVKWLLWHGKVDRALDRLGDLDRGVNHFADTYPRFPQLKKAVQKFRTYIENNRGFIPNYG